MPRQRPDGARQQEELLPVDWAGNKAFELTKKKLLPYLQQDKRVENLVLRNLNIYS